MKFVDTHCHLDFEPLSAHTAAVLERAHTLGVTRIIAPSYNAASWPQLRRISGHDGVFAAFGLHPWVADEELDIRELRTLLALPECRAVGEIGLDAKIDNADMARQIEVLKIQLDLALEFDLPVLLHCRGAFEELLEILRDYAPRLRGVLHAFSRGPELAGRFIDAGMHIAFGGALTRPTARQARRAAQTLQPDRLLLETDAPAIGLEDIGPREVEPAHVYNIAKVMAELREVPLEEIAEITTRNAERLFNIG